MISLLALLQGTPLWVWGLLIYILVIGVYSLQPRTTSIYRLNMLPAVFMIWSVTSMSSKYGFSFTDISVWTFAYTIGYLIGFCILGRMVRVSLLDTVRKTFRIEGSYVPLILGLTFFTIKYCFGAAYALHPELRTLMLFQITEILASGFIAGIAMGRLISISKTVSV